MSKERNRKIVTKLMKKEEMQLKEKLLPNKKILTMMTMSLKKLKESGQLELVQMDHLLKEITQM